MKRLAYCASARISLGVARPRRPGRAGRVPLASYVLETLRVRGAKESVVPRTKDYDLVDMQAVRRLYADARPTLVIHLAARVGGIEANRRNPR